MKIALFPGSFDPITKGHEDIVKRAIPLFDKIIVAIGQNSSKIYHFTSEKRKAFISDTFKNFPTVEVKEYSGLTVDFCKKENAQYILRGLRNPSDFEFEKSIAQMNRAMVPEIETVLILTAPEYSAISSTIVRDILKNGGNARQFVPEAILL